DADRFDIVAKADSAQGEVKDEQWREMIQLLLEDRFQLKYHREMKDRSVYALVGKLPTAFQVSKEEEQQAFVPGERGKVTFRHTTIIGLVNLTANVLRTQVVDGTGIEGFYNFTLDPGQYADPDSPASSLNYPDLMVTALR